MTTPAAAIATYLDTKVSLTAGTDLFVGRLQRSPDLCAAVADWSSAAPDFLFGSTAIDHPMIEVVVRCAPDDYATGAALANSLRSFIDAMPPGSYSGLTILRAEPLDSVRALGPDANHRPIFSARFEITVQR